MTFVRYKMPPEKLELYYAAYKRVFDSIRSDHQHEFHSIFHLYQGERRYDKENWITWYIDYNETDRWNTEDITHDLEVMMDCLGYDLKYVRIGLDPLDMGFICFRRPFQHLNSFFICRPCQQTILKSASICPQLFRRHQLLRFQSRHKNGIHYGRFLSKSPHSREWKR
jgi:hypothetical protein